MFCYKCGKEIAENSTFCTYCGAKQDFTAGSVPIPSDTPRSNLDTAPAQPPRSIPLPTEPSDAPVALAVPPAETEKIAVPAEPAKPAQELPPEQQDQPTQPSQPEQAEQPQPAAQPVPTEQPETPPFSAEVPLTAPAPEASEKPRKYYTGAHLAICLVITGIMAATAGVFAGLYFSVI